MVVLDYKETELKKIKKFFEGTMDTAENYIKSALKMLVK
jgi:holliday junction ATP-dependent DNA helicase ruvA